MDYVYICVASILFSVQSVFTKQFQKNAGEGLKSAFLYNVVSPMLFIVVMLLYEGMILKYSTYAFVMALLWAIICNAMTFFQIKALSQGNVANYALFLLGGGMVLPIVYGMLSGDDFGVCKIIGILLVCVAIVMKCDTKKNNKKSTFGCLIVLFFLNGLVGVLSAVYQSDLLPFEKVSAEQFSILRSFTTVGVGGVLLLVTVLSERRRVSGKGSARLWKNYRKAIPWGVLSGGINGLANLLLLLSLVTVQASLQYPIVTGGGIFLSAIVGLFFKEKTNRRTWIAVALAVIGTVVMMF